ncbi:MAG: FecR domain-containing protein [Planctomycetota bacterium]
MSSGSDRSDPGAGTTPTRADLVALALGALGEPEAGAVRAAVSASPDLVAELDAITRHLRRYDALPPAPPPPPVDGLLAALDGPRRARAPRREPASWPRLAAAALLLLAVGLVSWQAWDTSPTSGPGLEAAWAGSWIPEGVGGVVSAGTAVSQVHVSWPGDPGRRARLVAAYDTAIELGDGGRVTLERGRLWVESPAGPSAVPLVIHTPVGDVRVVGTRFEVDVDAARTLRVRVDRGVVEVQPSSGPGARVEAGHAWSVAGVEAAEAGLPTWHPRPAVLLRAARWTAEGALDVDAELRGDVGADVELPHLGAATGAPAWIEWIDADGEVDRSVPLEPDHVVAEGVLRSHATSASPDVVARWLAGEAGELPAGEVRRFTLRFAGPLPSGSAYRLRALFRPSGAAPWLTPAIDVEAPR